MDVVRDAIKSTWIGKKYTEKEKQRFKVALLLKQKAIQHPEDLTWSEIRLILMVLKQQKLLPLEYFRVNRIETDFYIKAAMGVLPCLIVGAFPLLIREIHSIKKWKRNIILVATAGISFCGYIYRPLVELYEFNRKEAQKYAGLLDSSQTPE